MMLEEQAFVSEDADAEAGAERPRRGAGRANEARETKEALLAKFASMGFDVRT